MRIAGSRAQFFNPKDEISVERQLEPLVGDWNLFCHSWQNKLIHPGGCWTVVLQPVFWHRVVFRPSMQPLPRRTRVDFWQLMGQPCRCQGQLKLEFICLCRIHKGINMFDFANCPWVRMYIQGTQWPPLQFRGHPVTVLEMFAL